MPACVTPFRVPGPEEVSAGQYWALSAVLEIDPSLLCASGLCHTEGPDLATGNVAGGHGAWCLRVPTGHLPEGQAQDGVFCSVGTGVPTL